MRTHTQQKFRTITVFFPSVEEYISFWVGSLLPLLNDSLSHWNITLCCCCGGPNQVLSRLSAYFRNFSSLLKIISPFYSNIDYIDLFSRADQLNLTKIVELFLMTCFIILWLITKIEEDRPIESNTIFISFFLFNSSFLFLNCFLSFIVDVD